MKKLTKSVLAVVLTASFTVSYAQKSKVDTTKTKDIEGVVVTALGIKREKKSLGYASQEVKADKLTSGTTKTGDIASLLSGKVAGLSVNNTTNFGGSTQLVIRGIKTLGGSTPLVVIDGSPVNNTTSYAGGFDLGNVLSDVNQEDVESINVLKGAAASALYGERGLNGVIVITTKNGKERADHSWGVTLSSSVQSGFVDKSTFPEYQDKYGAGYDPSFTWKGVAPGGLSYANFNDDASWGPKFDPNLLVYQWDSFDPTSPNYGKARPWVAAKNGPIKFFNTPFSFVNTIGLEKGNKRSNISISYTNQLSNGLLPNSDLKKNTLSAKLNYDFTDKLHSTVYSTLVLQNMVGRNETGYSDNIVTGFRQWWQTNVDVVALRNAYERNSFSNFAWNYHNPNERYPEYWNNPYFQRNQSYESDKRTRSFSYASATYDISKALSITGKLSYDNSNTIIENRLAVGSLNQGFGQSGKDVGSGYARQNLIMSEFNADLFANYKFNILSDLEVSGIFGGNIRRNYQNSVYNSTEGGLLLPNIYALGNSKSPVLSPQEDEINWLTASAYATASFAYKKFLYVDVTERIDKSSNLPKKDNPNTPDKETNVYQYPSITGSVILSELLKQDWLSFWKVRANYAEVGGTADAYKLTNTYTTAGIFNNDVGIFNSIITQANPDLRPQKSKEFEVGTEFNLFNNRINLDVAYYKTRTFNQLIVLPVSSGSGVQNVNINAGQINNSGIEAQLGLVPVKNSNFTWNIDVNWAKNKNEVVSLLHNSTTDVSNILIRSFPGGVSLNAREGEAWGTLVGSDYVYLNGQPVVDATTGRYLKQSNQIIGNSTPDWIGGIRNSFSYKGVSLSFLIDVKKGGDIYSLDMYYGLATGLYPETAAGTIRETGTIWTGVNPNGNVNTTVTADPSVYGSLDGYVNMPNKRFVYGAGFIKLREASIGYTLPKSVLANTFVNEAKISIVGRNLWIIDKDLPYADPEASVGGGTRAYGYSVGSLPTTRDIGVNITLKF